MKQAKKSGLAAKINVIFLSMLSGLLLLFVLLCPAEGMTGHGSLPARAGDQALNKTEILAKAASISIPFVKNVGQFHGEVTYAADLFAGRFFLTGRELVYALLKPGENAHVQPGKRGLETDAKKRSASGKGLVFKEFFIDHKGARIAFTSAGEGQTETVVSYFKGSDSSRWRSGVASYHGVSLGEIYPSIEVKLKASGRNVEKIFYVSPLGNVGEIRIGIAGVDGLKIAEDGRLLFKNCFGELAMRAPIAWQEIAGKRRDVKVGYRLLGKSQYGFSVTGSYDKNQALIIDPDLDTLTASTYLGGNSWDILSALALDRSGNILVAGRTNSTNFPMSTGAFDSHLYEKGDIFVAKLNGSLTKLLASTFLGGEESDGCNSLAVDSSGNVYLVGYTRSRNFPTTRGAFDRVFNDGNDPNNRYGYGDVFIAKLDSGLTKLSASTYLGGNKSEMGNSLVLDGSGDVYLTGVTESADFPTTLGAFDPTHNASTDLDHKQKDAFVSKFDLNLTKLQASTFLGGGDNDSGHCLVLDNLGKVYLTGYSNSKDFPTTAGTYNPNWSGGEFYGDAFISELDENLASLLASTYLGGGDEDVGNSLALDSYGNVYVTGYTGDRESGDFPTTQGAYCRENNGWTSGYDSYCMEDIFVSKLDRNLSSLLASTYLGGYDDDVGNSLALDSSGNVYVTGTTQSKDFPTTAGAFDRTYDSGESYYYSYGNVYVSMLDSNLTFLLASTYLGSGYSQGSSLALDNSGNVFLAGTTNAKDFPATAGAYNKTKNDNGSLDAFVSKLKLKLNIPMSAIGVISPDGRETWRASTTQNIAWKTAGTIAEVKIEYTLDNGAHWIEVIAATANNGSYLWIVPATPSSRCLVRISDVVNAAISDTSGAVFSILLGLDLQAERREIRALSIMRQYGAIRFLYANPDHPAAQYRLMRRKGDEGFVMLKMIASSELQNNQFQMQDKYLEKGIPYTYRVEAFDANGQLVGISTEHTI